VNKVIDLMQALKNALKGPSYRAFLEAKAALAKPIGFDCDPDEVNPILKPHQRDVVAWAVRGGRRAIFAAFGLGKTMMQLEAVRLVLEKSGGGKGLIVMPLGVRSEFYKDAAKLGLTVTFIRSVEDATADGIYLTNYESVRDGKLDPRGFTAVSLDEAAVLRGFGGTKTFREFMRLYEGTASYRFVATATPSPNEYIELLSYAAFLDVMDVGQAKTRFFKRDSTKADVLTLHPHKEREFWLWVASWAMFIQKPSDLGYSDDGYLLPPLEVRWHELPAQSSTVVSERDGQGRLLHDTSLGVTAAAREKRESIPARITKLRELVGASREQAVVWCDLNDEQEAIEGALTAEGLSATSLYGAQDVDTREELLQAWRDNKTTVFLSKPMMYGAGVNLQQCHRMFFAGIGFKFAEVIQAVHRIYRFLQEQPCTVDFIYTEAEREVRKILEGKWQKHNELVAKMGEIIREYGLSQAAMLSSLQRSIGVTRAEASGEHYRLINNDAVDETAQLPDNSVDLIITSIPFATQYEYTPSYNDFGHTESNAHFWEQMDFLTPQMLRVLQPGRVCAIHVKDRIVPGGLTGLGFQTVAPFHAEAISHYQKHGFAYLGMKTIVTDVVRENNQTYRLGWTEQCKDGSRMGCGMPEYVLLFRKPPTDSSNGYADTPVVKDKSRYTLARWQVDANGFARSSGNRLLAPTDLEGIPHAAIYKLFRKYSLTETYDYEQHIALVQSLLERRMLPVTFALMPPHSWHPDVWTDVARMRTLNTFQSQKNREMHLCPLQFDIVDRLIVQHSMAGETVFDPFAGLGTVPYCAVKLGRRGLGVELSATYHAEAVRYCEAASQQRGVPSLFDLEDDVTDEAA